MSTDHEDCGVAGGKIVVAPVTPPDFAAAVDELEDVDDDDEDGGATGGLTVAASEIVGCGGRIYTPATVVGSRTRGGGAPLKRHRVEHCLQASLHQTGLVIILIVVDGGLAVVSRNHLQLVLPS